MKKLKERVRQILSQHTGARQSDNILMTILWSEDLFHIDAKNKTSTSVFFKLFMEGKLTNTESARRVRQQLQANNPELRDKEVYEARHKKEPEYRKYFSSRYNFIGRK